MRLLTGGYKGGKLGDSLFENGNPWQVQGGLDIGVGKYKVITGTVVDNCQDPVVPSRIPLWNLNEVG